MIYDKISNIKHYLGAYPHLDTAIHFIMEHKLEDLPLGKTVIDGDNVFVNIMDAKTIPADEKQYEIHKNYMDIQIDIAGIEAIHIGDEQDFICPNFNAEGDIGLGTASYLCSCIMGVGNFMVCMANEPHKPAVLVGDNPEVRKCVFKVHI